MKKKILLCSGILLTYFAVARTVSSWELYKYTIGFSQQQGAYLTAYPVLAGQDTVQCFRNDNPQFFDALYRFIKELKAAKNRWSITSTHTSSSTSSGTHPVIPAGDNTEIGPAWATTYENNSRQWANTVLLAEFEINDTKGTVTSFKIHSTRVRTYGEQGIKSGSSSSSTMYYWSSGSLQSSSGNVQYDSTPPINVASSFPEVNYSILQDTDLGILLKIQSSLAPFPITDIVQRENPELFSLVLQEVKEIVTLQNQKLRYAGGTANSYAMGEVHSGIRSNTTSGGSTWSISSSGESTQVRGYPDPMEHTTPSYNLELEYFDIPDPEYPGGFLFGGVRITGITRFADDIYRTLAILSQ